MNVYVEPEDMRWPDLDPARHPFVWDDAEQARVVAVVSALTADAASVAGPRTARWQLLPDMTEMFTERYGQWAAGWHWEVQYGGPVVRESQPSGVDASTPEGHVALAAAGLVQWRGWLEELADTFARYAAPPGAAEDVRREHVERAAVLLVTAVADRTEVWECWAGLIAITLRWYFESCGLTPEEADAAAATATDGRFESWTHPEDEVVRDYAVSLATKVTGATAHRDR